MILSVEIKSDNEAMVDGLVFSSSTILETIARRIRNGDTSGKCNDYNGNIVGFWELKE